MDFCCVVLFAHFIFAKQSPHTHTNEWEHITATVRKNRAAHTFDTNTHARVHILHTIIARSIHIDIYGSETIKARSYGIEQRMHTKL